MRHKNIIFRETYSGVIPSTTYLTHGIHHYTAKLIPHIPRYIIEEYTSKGDIILDPFCGSGTVLLEARLLSRSAMGIDINPLAVLISQVKTTPLNPEELDLAVHMVKEEMRKSTNGEIVDFPNINYWFCKNAQNELSIIKSSLDNLRNRFGRDVNRFLAVCFSSIVRKSSYADPRMAKTYKSKRVVARINSGWVPVPIQYFELSLDQNSERVGSLSEHLNSNNNCVEVSSGDARDTQAILKQKGIEEVDFIITSPPYINAQDYFRSYKLELWWLGLATPEEVRHLNTQAIGTESISGDCCDSSLPNEDKTLELILSKIGRIDKKKSRIVHKYFAAMEGLLKEFYDVLRKGGYFCLVTGNNTICGTHVQTHRILARMAKQKGFKPVEIVRDEIRNRSLPPNRKHDGGIIKEEWIAVFRKK